MNLPPIPWRLLALGALVGGALLNEKVLSKNPELERKLAGCWVGTADSVLGSPRSISFMFEPDGTFVALGPESMLIHKGPPKVMKAAGTWKIQRTKWTLQSTDANWKLLFPYSGSEWNLKVLDLSDEALDAVGYGGNGRRFSLSRGHTTSGQCMGQAQSIAALLTASAGA